MAQPKFLLDKKQIEMIETFRKYPEIAAESILMRNGRPLQLTWYQRVALRNLWEKQFNLMIWSRGLGKSATLAMFLILRALLYPRERCGIVSSSYRQAKNVFDEVARFYDESPLLQSSCVKPPSKGVASCELPFLHGSSIEAHPLGDGNKLRGLRFQCVAGGTLIATNRGLVPIERLVSDQNDYLVETHRGVWQKPDAYIRKPKDSVLVFRTKFGFEITTSPIHPLMTEINGEWQWVKANEQAVGNKLVLRVGGEFPTEYVTLENRPDSLPNKFTPDMGRLFGYLLSDSTINHRSIMSFYQADPEIRRDYIRTFQKVCGAEPKTYGHTVQISRSKIRQYFERIGLIRAKLENQEIPWIVLQSPRDVVTEFLRALFEGDGHIVTQDGIEIRYFSKSEKLLHQLQVLLLRYGIVSSINKGALIIFGANAAKFMKEIGFISSKNKSKIDLSSVEPYNSSEYITDEIVSITPSEAVTYDMHVPGDHSFIGNGFVNHNTLCVDETAQVPSEIIDVVLLPMMNVRSDPWAKGTDRKNHLVMASTAYYQFNHLYDRYLMFRKKTDPSHPEYDPDYGLTVFNVFDAPEGWIDIKILNQQKATMTRSQWLLENLSVFAADSDGFYPASLFENARALEVRPKLKGEKGKQYVLGIDPARHGDNFAVAIIELGNPYHEVVYVNTLHRKTIQQQHEFIRGLLRDFNIVKIVMDQGGGGSQIMDLLAEKYAYYDENAQEWVTDDPIIDPNMEGFSNRPGRRILEVVQFTAKSATEMNFAFKADLENERIRFPRIRPEHDQQLEKIFDEIDYSIDECLNIVATPLQSGFLKFEPPKKTQKRDRYSALVLASYAAREFLKKPEEQTKKLATGFWSPIAFRGGVVD